VDFGRRTVLERVALGGAMFAALGVGGTEVADAQEAPCGVLQPVAAGKIRRVVTGVNAEGQSKVVSDSQIDLGVPWTTDPNMPIGQGPADEKAYASQPSKLRSRCDIASLAPNKDPKPDMKNRQGYHFNPVRGITYVLVLSGNITHLLDLEEVKLKAGDLLVMRDTEHSWRNDGSEPVKLFVAAVAA
jgi:hypothetical protein